MFISSRVLETPQGEQQRRTTPRRSAKANSLKTAGGGVLRPSLGEERPKRSGHAALENKNSDTSNNMSCATWAKRWPMQEVRHDAMRGASRAAPILKQKVRTSCGSARRGDVVGLLHDLLGLLYGCDVDELPIQRHRAEAISLRLLHGLQDAPGLGPAAQLVAAMSSDFFTICSACFMDAMSMSFPSKDTAPRPSRCACSMASRMRLALVTSGSEGL